MLSWRGRFYIGGGSKLAFDDIDREAEMIDHLSGFPQVFLGVTLKSESV
jgi:hypothetical protein